MSPPPDTTPPKVFCALFVTVVTASVRKVVAVTERYLDRECVLSFKSSMKSCHRRQKVVAARKSLGEPSGGNIGSESELGDTTREQSSDYDQGSMQIGKENFSETNIFKNNDVPTNLFNIRKSNTRESNTLRRSSRRSKFPPKQNDYVFNSKLDVNNAFLYGNLDEDVYMLPSQQEKLRDTNPDVNNAFLYGNLDEDVYMLPPPGYFDKNETRVCKLKRHDHSLYTKESNGSFVTLLFYVDDIMLTGNDINEINKVKSFLKSKFKIKDLGELKYFLCTEVLKTEKVRLCLSQRKYCLELLHDYGLLACKPASIPLPENIILAHKESEDDKFLKNITSYQRLVGKLIYLTLTRPDISYSVHCLSQYMQAPLLSHMDLGLRVKRYLKGAPGSGVNYEKYEHMSLKVYANSD
nr:ribonuclease H-like domain-containing protein [Tanacetum cinerariifolium]